jgi:hypothetical protein
MQEAKLGPCELSFDQKDLSAVVGLRGNASKERLDML